MKQVVIQGGQVRVLDVPAPQVADRSILVRVTYSAISAGTEIAGLRSASLPLYRRALKQPAKLRRALQLVRERGLMDTLDRARGESVAAPLGYSATGAVVRVGEQVDGFAVGDRVACAGASVANHAETIVVPVNLAVRVPAAVEPSDAATVALGAIAMQGVRRAAPTLGETFLVIGLGFIGQLTVQLLHSSGCRVIGVDPDRDRVATARAAGMEASVNPHPSGYVAEVASLTDGFGADAAIVTAAAKTDEVINNAMQACRRKGRVVLVGDVGLNLDRSALYAKELDFLVSTSYGPGRYDSSYEADGQDYPLPYVRWTENRNMAAYLELLASGRIELTHMAKRIWPVEKATEAYADLSAAGTKPLLALLQYSGEPHSATATRIEVRPPPPVAGNIRVALIGAGSFAQAVHLPNLAKMKELFQVRAVMSRTGTNARLVAERAGAAYASSNYEEILADADVDVVMIATRHNVHADMALAALKAGKHVFVEKPLAITAEQLSAIEKFYEANPAGPLLFTGFNRRFSPAAKAAREILAQRRAPAVLSYRVNAGFVPAEHWVHGAEGGGRNIGEACHFYDLFNFLLASMPARVTATAIAPPSRQLRRDDNFLATIRYEDGSVCELVYCALGTPAYPKESLDVFVDGLVLSIEDYKRLKVWGGTLQGWQGRAPDKGHLDELRAFGEGLRSGQWPITLADQIAAMRIAFEVQSALRH